MKANIRVLSVAALAFFLAPLTLPSTEVPFSTGPAAMRAGVSLPFMPVEGNHFVNESKET